MSQAAWIFPLSMLVATAHAQELGGDEQQPSQNSLLEELRRLRSRVDLLESARSPNENSQGSIDLSGEELPSIQVHSDHVLARPWFENVDLSGYAALTYFDSGGVGTLDDGSFIVKEASLFLDVQLWERVSLFDETLLLRFPNPDQFSVGELHVKLTGLFASEGEGGVGLKVGRIEIPFGEDYLRWDAHESPWITYTAADPYGIDEGVELYGKLGGANWIAALTNGASGTGRDDGPAKLVAVKLYGEPCADVYSSVSLLTTGNTTRSAFRLSGAPITPVGAGASSSAGVSPSGEVNATCWEADARIAESRRVSLALQLGQAFIEDDADSFDRDLTWYGIESSVRLSDDVDLLVRYSEIGTNDSDTGYIFSGKPVAQAEDLGFDTHALRRLSGGLCWTVNPHLVGKVEVGHDWLDLIDVSPLAEDNHDRLFFGLELVASF